VRLPPEVSADAEMDRRLADLAMSAYEQYPGILLLPPTLEGRAQTRAGYRYMRIEFRIWPGQAAVLEKTVAGGIVHSMKELDPNYADWMVTVHYRSESPSRDPRKRLPRPAALHARETDARGGSSDSSIATRRDSNETT
jgi:hypothetical protein